jgi:dephospho-CoA kinase
MIIGVTGTDGSGKDLVGQMLWEKLGWPHFSLSDEIRDIAREKGLDLSRETLANLANQLRIEFGPDYLAKRIVKRVSDNFVATSIRNPHEMTPFQTKDNFVLIAVDAPTKIRYQRTFSRDRAGESNRTLEDFRHHEALVEMTDDKFGQQLQKMLSLADYMIINDGTFKELEKKIDNLIQKITHAQPTN